MALPSSAAAPPLATPRHVSGLGVTVPPQPRLPCESAVLLPFDWIVPDPALPSQVCADALGTEHKKSAVESANRETSVKRLDVGFMGDGFGLMLIRYYAKRGRRVQH